MTREQIEARIAELEAANEAAPGWGAAVGARSEEIKGLKRQLPCSADSAHLTDQELRRRWREAGGEFYGPHTETGSMPEAKLLPFLRALSAPVEVNQFETTEAGVIDWKMEAERANRLLSARSRIPTVAQSSQVTIEVIASALRIALDSFERDVCIDSLTENEIMHLARVAQDASQPSPAATVDRAEWAINGAHEFAETMRSKVDLSARRYPKPNGCDPCNYPGCKCWESPSRPSSSAATVETRVRDALQEMLNQFGGRQKEDCDCEGCGIIRRAFVALKESAPGFSPSQDCCPERKPVRNAALPGADTRSSAATGVAKDRVRHIVRNLASVNMTEDVAERQARRITDALESAGLIADAPQAVRERLCQKCGEPTKSEEALVEDQIWCHPCADAHPHLSSGNESPDYIEEAGPVPDRMWNTAASEPVAWRWKVSPMQLNWQYSDTPPPAFPVYNLELLYNTPPQTVVWQPIETAPMDTNVLMAWLYDGQWEIKSGWAGSTKGGYLHSQATHWKPLPTPPVTRPLSNCEGGE